MAAGKELIDAVAKLLPNEDGITVMEMHRRLAGRGIGKRAVRYAAHRLVLDGIARRRGRGPDHCVLYVRDTKGQEP